MSPGQTNLPIPDEAVEIQDILEALSSRLVQAGASVVKIVEAADIVVDERVRLKCQIPLCDSYGKNLMCPPLVVPSLEAFRQALTRYAKALLIQITAPLPETLDKTDVYAPARQLHDLVNLAEKWAFAYQRRFAFGLIGGCCRLCDVCVAVTQDSFCRHPFRARPSMEAMGIDVVATVARAGLGTHFPISDKVTWTGVLLL